MQPDASPTTNRFARFVSGRTSKWLILGFWVVILAVAFSPANKLTGAQENDAVAWLPGDAESTIVLHEMESFQSSDETPAVIVYERPGGATTKDIAAVAGQVKQFDDVEHVTRDSVGPLPSKDQQALQVIVPIDPGSGGWTAIGTTVDELQKITESTPDGLSVHVTGPGGYAADSSAAFDGIDGKLLLSAVAVVIVILLFTYRSPMLWILPVFSAVVSLFVAEAVVYLLATQAGLTVNAQSAGILTVLVFGAGTDYALLLVARYREELRRHEDRHEAMAFAMYALRPRDHRQRLDGDRRHALPAAGQHELHPGPRPGRRRRHRGRAGRHAHPAAGAAGDLRPLVLLAAAPDVRQRRPHRDRRLGAGRPAHRPPAAHHLGRHRAGAGRRVDRHPAARRERPEEQGRLLRQARLGRRRGGAGAALPGRLRAAGRRDHQVRQGRRGHHRVQGRRPASTASRHRSPRTA